MSTGEVATAGGSDPDPLVVMAKRHIAGKTVGKLVTALKKRREREPVEEDLEGSDCDYESTEEISASQVKERARFEVTIPPPVFAFASPYPRPRRVS